MNDIMFAGLRIIESPLVAPVARMRLSEKVREIVTPEFAAEMDAWMLEFFGTKQVALMFRDPFSGRASAAVAPLTMAMLRAAQGMP
jgi:hypothetical protein